jgi:hypothetical protein
MTDSNRRHLRCKRSALPTELIAHSEAVHSGLPREWQAGNLCFMLLLRKPHLQQYRMTRRRLFQ